MAMGVEVAAPRKLTDGQLIIFPTLGRPRRRDDDFVLSIITSLALVLSHAT